MCPQTLTSESISSAPAGRDRFIESPNLSRQALKAWLRFQFNPASYIDSSYKGLLLPSAKKTISAPAAKTEGKDDKQAEDCLGLLWRKAVLSRRICEVFSLDFADFPQRAADLSFFTRLAMIEADDLQHLLRSMGLLLSSHEIAMVIDQAAVANLKKGLGKTNYDFATHRGLQLCPSKDWISLRLDELSRSRLGEGDFHVELGLRLLLLHSKKHLTKQSLQRLALKCPRAVITKIETGVEGGLALGLAVFEQADEQTRIVSLWSGLVKEVIGRWHDWLAS